MPRLVAVVVVGGCIAPTDPITLGGGGGGSGPPTGTVEFSVTTTGSNLDPNGYQLLFNEEDSQAIGTNGTVTMTVAAGSYQVTLVDVATNCAVDGMSNPRSFSVTGGSSTDVAFAVVCA